MRIEDSPVRREFLSFGYFSSYRRITISNRHIFVQQISQSCSRALPYVQLAGLRADVKAETDSRETVLHLTASAVEACYLVVWLSAFIIRNIVL